MNPAGAASVGKPMGISLLAASDDGVPPSDAGERQSSDGAVWERGAIDAITGPVAG